MIIGLLKCDTVKPEFQKEFGDFDSMFRQLFRKKDHQIEFQVFNVIKGEYPKEINSCDGYLITGSAYSINDNDPWISELSLFIHRLYRERKKTVGICFGHQLIAKALGGEATKSEKGWGIGVMETKIERHESWMVPKLDQFSIITSHQDQAVRMPEDGILLGSNSFCRYSMYRVNDYMLCMQGHPELSPKYAEALFKSRREIIGEEKVQKAIESLKQETDHQIIANWMINFFSE